MGAWLPALLLAACAAVPPESRMDEAGSAPGRWTATREAKAGVDDHWVKRFGDRNLTRLVGEAYESNRDLRAAAARVERSAAVAKGAGAAAKPQVNAALQAGRQKQNFVGFPIGTSGGVLTSLSESYGASLNISWEPDVWGKIRAGEAAALADLQAQGWTYRGARASLAAQVVRSWLLLAEANEQIALAELALKVRRDTSELIRGRFELAGEDGGAMASQLRLAETDVATAKANVAQRKSDRDQAQRQLEILLGRYPSAKIAGAAKLPKVPPKPPAGLPSELLQRRPDILAAERRLASGGKRVDEARLAFYPSFPLTASGGTTSEQLRNIFNSSYGVWSIAGQVAQPILTGGTLTSQLEARGAEEKESLALLQQTVLNGFGEVEIALAGDQFLATREAAIGEAFDFANEGAISAERDFSLGTGDVLTLLAAQNRRIELATQKLTLRRVRLDNRVNLHLALGGDYKL